MENQPTQPQMNYLPPVPNATAVLVLGIISIPTCICYGIIGLACGIIALVLAGKGKAAYLANPNGYTQSSYNNLKAGRICAIIGVVLSSIYLAFVVIYVVFLGTALSTMPWDMMNK